MGGTLRTPLVATDQPSHNFSPSRFFHRKDSQRRQTRRSSRRAADEVRAGDQSKDSQADRSYDSTECVGEGGQSHKINFGFSIADFRFGLGSRTMRKTLWTESPSGSNLKSKIQNLKWGGIVAVGVAF